jgi:hypothetical protein
MGTQPMLNPGYKRVTFWRLWLTASPGRAALSTTGPLLPRTQRRPGPMDLSCGEPRSVPEVLLSGGAEGSENHYGGGPGL